MQLRLKHRSGQQVVSTLNSTSTVADLLAAVHDALPHTASLRVSLRAGYPPKSIDTVSSEALTKFLEQIPIKDGETIIVEEQQGPLQAPLPSTAPAPAMTQALLDQLSQSHDTAGFMTRQTIPADNSCLFTAVNFALTGQLDSSKADYMRQLVASLVASDPDTYNDAVLAMPNADYVRWILDRNHWGGGIEVSLLSKAYGVEIAVVDTQTTRVDRFGETENCSERLLLLYDGIHYDTIAWESAHTGQLTTRFPIHNEQVLVDALQLAREAKASRQFTDVAKFTLKCCDCNEKLVGSREAQDHANRTGHVNFGEV